MDTILFDLDGTLLPMDMKLFEKIYFEELSVYFEDLIPKEEFINSIWTATISMVKNLEDKTNEVVFVEEFGQKVGKNINIYMDRFDAFYDTNFKKVKAAVKDVPIMRNSIQILKDKGYNIIIATNPLFPKKAIYERVRWAGFKPEEFSYISTFEQNHYCKPQLHYYREILEHIGKTPEDCLMVGNDVQEDLIVSKLGVKTYLINNHLLHRTDEEIISDYSGNYEDFFSFVNELPSIK